LKLVQSCGVTESRTLFAVGVGAGGALRRWAMGGAASFAKRYGVAARCAATQAASSFHFASIVA
jgi:hypothetical protein